jgi:hypothetical protein
LGIEIGVVGPHDLVEDVSAICRQQPGVAIRPFGYRHEAEAPAIVREHTWAVQAWLFTGVVAYTIARDAEVLTRPTTFVDYTGATLLRALVRLLRDGYDVTRLSIDTVTNADVTATYREAGLPVEHVRTLPYRSGLSSADVVAFHRRKRQEGVGTTAAVTCLSSAHEVLRGEMAVLRLAPSPHSVRVALRQLLLHANSQAQEDAQIALGLVELDPARGTPGDAARGTSGGTPGDVPGGTPGDVPGGVPGYHGTPGDRADGLLREAAALGGSLAVATGGEHLLVTTRGPLAEVTGNFTALPMLRRLADRHRVVRVGFGLGRSAAEAESLARRALGRARRLGDVAAVLALRGDTDLVLESTTPPPQPGVASLAVLSQRVGLSVPTLQRLRSVRDDAGAQPLTTREVATQLGVQQRTARRMLHRLELAGLAERIGNLTSGASGRPLTLYRLTL